MKRFKKVLSSFLVLTLTVTAPFTSRVASAEESNLKEIQVISFNDFHGALVPTDSTDKNIGAAKLTQAIKDEIEKNPNTLVVSAGDNYNGTALSNLLYGKPVSDFLRNIDIVASAVGNHEFDWGLDKIPEWAKDMNAPFVAANIYERATDTPVDWAEPFIIEEVDGVKVAFIGLTTQETAYKTKPENVENIEFKNPVEIANEWVPVVKDNGADIIILLTHIGTFQDRTSKEITFEEGAENLPYIENVDAIITAHSHQTVAGEINGVPIVQAYYNGRSLAKLNFTVDAKTNNLISATGAIDEVYARSAEVGVDSEIESILKDYTTEVSPILDKVIGSTETGLLHKRGEGDLTPLGQWTSEVMRQAAGSQIAVTNNGGIRTSIEAGDITMGDMYAVMPFDNVLSEFKMTGAQIKEVFEHGIENTEIGFIQFSGVIVEYVKGAEVGSKVVSMKLENGEVIEDDKVYTVVTNDFMGTGGDNFSTFLEAEFIGDTIPIRDVMVEAIQETGELNYSPNQLLFEVPRLEEMTVEQEEIIVEATPITTTLEKVKEVVPVVEVVNDITRAATVVEEVKEATPVEVVVNETTDTASQKYIVEEDDVLWKIAKKFSLEWETLAKYNNLDNPHLIFTGQTLLIP